MIAFYVYFLINFWFLGMAMQSNEFKRYELAIIVLFGVPTIIWIFTYAFAKKIKLHYKNQ